MTTNQQKPCESAHEITLKLGESDDIKPLTLSFPYPFAADKIHTSIHLKDRFIGLKLKKALREPWPCEFQSKSKWDAKVFKPWVEIKGSRSLQSHLKSQANLFKHPSETKTSSLERVRLSIMAIFSSCLQHSEDINLRVQLKIPKEIPDLMLIRVHQPLLTSPVGNPTLILTVVDFQFAETRKEFDSLTSEKNFKRIFPDYKEQDSNHVIVVNTAEEAKLFRYVLRVNSTKMLPSTWQKENIPSVENSHWLPTFLSPLYLHSPYFFYDYLKNICTDTETLLGNICASCTLRAEKLWRCSRCASVFYCSLSCQRAHWSQHKGTHIEKCHLLLMPKLSSGPRNNLDQKLTSKGYRCVANFRQTDRAPI